MEGEFQVDQGWLERHTTFSLTLTESTLWRWEQIAREQNITDNSAFASFLLRHYEATRASLMQPSFCTSCGSPLGQFCATCFSLAPKVQQQVVSSQTTLLGGWVTHHVSCQTDLSFCPKTTNPSDHHFKSEDGPVKTAGLEASEATPENLDYNTVSDNDDFDDEYYARLTAGPTVKSAESKTDITPENEKCSEVDTKESTSRVSEVLMCEICLQIFFDPDQLVRHTQIHSDHMPHECPQCQARFFQQDVLQLHMDLHLQQKRHPGDQDNAFFSTVDRLHTHTTLMHKTTRKEKGGVLMNPSLGALHHRENAENVEMMKETTWNHIQEKSLNHVEGEQSCLQHYVYAPTDQQSSVIPSETCSINDSGADTHRTKFTCTQCGREFHQRHHFERHVLTHSGEKRYGCQQCGAAFAQLNSLIVHMHSHYRHKPFLCGKCNKSFTTLSYMTKHACKGSRPQCVLCRKMFGNEDQLSVHACRRPEHTSLLSKSETTGIADQDFDREAANQKLSTRRKTRSVTLKEKGVTTNKRSRGRPPKNARHSAKTKGKVSDMKPVPDQAVSSSEDRREEAHPHCCKFCGACFMFLNHLIVHQQGHTGESAFKCSYCADSFKSVARLANHLRSHYANKEFPCKYCGKVLKSQYTLKEHLRSHTGEKPFKCSVCNSCFTLSSTYKAHMRTHTGDRPYLCPHCGKSFVRSSNLSVHIRACTGDKPYTCAECGKSFSDVGYYKKHVNNHAGIKRYKCEYCGKAFTQSTTLKVHIRTHTGEKPYKCSKCPMAFAIPNSLTEHMRKHTGDKPYKCSICGKGFAKSCNRLAHFRTHNKNKPVIGPQLQGAGTAEGAQAFALSV